MKAQQRGTLVAVPHINFDEPTGNPLVELRKGFGLTSIEKRDRRLWRRRRRHA